MGLFGKILSGIEIVAGAVLMATGVGAIAGAMLITAGLASSGLIKGSVGKFLNSGWGQGLMAAVSLGSTAYAMYGSSLLQDAAATASENASQVTVSSAAEAGAVSDSAAAGTADLAAGTGGSDLLQTGTSLSETAGYNTASAISAESAQAGGTSAQELGQASSVIDPLNPEANLALTQSNEAATTAGNTLAEGGGSTSAVTPGGGAPTDPGLGGGSPGGKMLGVSQAGEGPTGASVPGGATAADTAAVAPTSSAPGDMLDGSGIGSSPGGAPGAPAPGAAAGAPPAPGMMGRFMNWADAHPTLASGALEGGGKMLGGIGAGMEQKSAMEDQIRAQQWAGRTYMDPQAQAQLQGAAAAPITVPSGYLQRAQALRNMLKVQPGAPSAPIPYRG